jgi:hypothetical protein
MYEKVRSWCGDTLSATPPRLEGRRVTVARRPSLTAARQREIRVDRPNWLPVARRRRDAMTLVRKLLRSRDHAVMNYSLHSRRTLSSPPVRLGAWWSGRWRTNPRIGRLKECWQFPPHVASRQRGREGKTTSYRFQGLHCPDDHDEMILNNDGVELRSRVGHWGVRGEWTDAGAAVRAPEGGVLAAGTTCRTPRTGLRPGLCPVLRCRTSQRHFTAALQQVVGGGDLRGEVTPVGAYWTPH